MKKFLALLVAGTACGAWASLRIVSLSPAVTELICRMDGANLLVGRSEVCDRPPQVKNLPVAGKFGIPDPEKILLLHADCVITNDLVNPAAEKMLARHGVKVAVFPCRNVADYENMVDALGGMLHRPEYAAREKKRISDALKKWRAMPRRPLRVLMVIWEKPLVVAGDKTFCNELLDLSGVDPVDFKGRSGFFVPDAEYLLQSDPDVLLVFHGTQTVFSHPVLKKLRAVREGNVIALADEGLFQRPGPRWPDAVEILREKWEKR